MSLGGTEQFHSDGREAGFGVLDFWRWSASDLLMNTQRGVVAEYLVARALGVMDSLQTSQWAGWDILGPGRVRIEVKSAAYWQSWSQEKPSEITFQGIGPRKLGLGSGSARLAEAGPAPARGGCLCILPFGQGTRSATRPA